MARQTQEALAVSQIPFCGSRQIEYIEVTANVGMPCGKTAVAKCGDCGSAICSDCCEECCGDSFCGQCYDYHVTNFCVRKLVQDCPRSFRPFVHFSSRNASYPALRSPSHKVR